MREDSSTPQHRVPRVTLNCRRCKRPFEVLASQSLVSGGPYCSPDCAGKAKQTPMEDRFWASIERRPNGCWNWKKAFSHGRPILCLPGHGARYVRADLYAYELHFSPLPPGGKMHQTCGNFGCVNPDHMAEGPRPRQPRKPRPPSANPRPARLPRVCPCGRSFSVQPAVAAMGRGTYCGVDCRRRYSIRTAEERFWAKVDKNGPLPPDHPELGPCSIWKGARVGKYGAFAGTTAHRFALKLYGRPAPEDGDACHKCDVPLCVRDSHLFPGTKPDNIHDMVAKERNSTLLNPMAVRVIRFLWENRLATQAALARSHRVHATTIQRVIRRQTWDHIS